MQVPDFGRSLANKVEQHFFSALYELGVNTDTQVTSHLWFKWDCFPPTPDSGILTTDSTDWRNFWGVAWLEESRLWRKASGFQSLGPFPVHTLSVSCLWLEIWALGSQLLGLATKSATGCHTVFIVLDSFPFGTISPSKTLLYVALSLVFLSQ